MTNKEKINLYRNQNKYVKFTDFLDNIKEFLDNEQVKPCFSCEKNGLPNCGNDYCFTNKEKK